MTGADAGTLFVMTGGWTTLTLPTAASAGAGFALTVKGLGLWATIMPAGSEQVDSAAAPMTLLTNAVVQLVTDGTTWYSVYSQGTIYRSKPELCGANCYNTSAAMASGLAYTGSNKLLFLSSGVWVQADGNNVLRVDGSDNWHRTLTDNGRDYTVSGLLNKTVANLGGRACPAQVYVNDSNRVATGICVYYDKGIGGQYLNAAGTSQTTASSIGLDAWNVAGTGNGTLSSWYEGNIQTCANKGMRLPLLYETTAAQPAATNLPADQAPTTWSTLTTGVPSVGGGFTWTSSAYTSGTSGYWLWAGTSTNGSSYNGNAVRCVVP